uniref:Uncharacterized protein n=2 Tax=Anguilla anguilla TaxID=7936 RepID=A0A0E9RTZ7_ANGAN
MIIKNNNRKHKKSILASFNSLSFEVVIGASSGVAHRALSTCSSQAATSAVRVRPLSLSLSLSLSLLLVLLVLLHCPV